MLDFRFFRDWLTRLRIFSVAWTNCVLSPGLDARISRLGLVEFAVIDFGYWFSELVPERLARLLFSFSVIVVFCSTTAM